MDRDLLQIPQTRALDGHELSKDQNNTKVKCFLIFLNGQRSKT
jgi:hypothetical protein